MNKKLALFLSWLLLLMSFAPSALAAEPAAQSVQTPAGSSSASQPSDVSPTAAASDKSDEKSDETSDENPETTVTEETYWADQLKDLKTLSKDDRKKINTLLVMYAIDQTSDDTFGADVQITRSQMAKTAALTLGLTIKTLVSSSYRDVSTTDPAFPYIEALRTAKLVNDKAETYNPLNPVTRQELAKLLVQGLGLTEDAEAEPPVKDDTVDSEYRSYVAYAVKQKIMTNQQGGKFEGKSNVTRKTLALAAYEALNLHQTSAKPDKASIAEVKLIGKNKLSVRLNRDVDSGKAEIMIRKAGELDSDNKPVDYAGMTEWSDDQATAVVEMNDDFFKFGRYDVILTGVDVEVGTLSFMAENERVTKIEFVTDTEKLPWSKALVEYKAVNQYGENMKLTAGNMEIFAIDTRGIHVPQTILDNSNAIILDLSGSRPQDTVTVRLWEKSSYIAVLKDFTVGEPPMIQELDLGDPESNVKLPSGQTVFKAGGRAYLTFKAFDQYGNRIVDPKYLNMQIGKLFTGAYGNSFRMDSPNDFVDFDNDGFPELQLAAFPNLDSNKTVTVNLLFNGKQVSQDVTVLASKTPYTVVIGPLTSQLTEGDTDKTIGLKVIDSTGTALEGAEIADLETTGKISVSSSGNLVLEASPSIRKDPVTGQDRQVKVDLSGAIRIKQVTAPGPAFISVRITGLNETVTLPLNIEAIRRPDSIVLDENSSARSILAINGLAKAKTGAVFKIYDQFGAEYYTKRDDYKVEMKLEKVSGESGALTTKGPVTLNDAKPSSVIEITDLVSKSGGKSIDLVPDAKKKGSYMLTASLVTYGEGKIGSTLSFDSLIVDVDDQNNPNLTYSLDMKSGDLLAIGRILYDANKIDTVTNATYLFKHYKALAKDVNLLVKDSQGLDTGLSVKVRAVTSDNPKAMAYTTEKGIGKIIGLDSGKFNFTVYFDTPQGVKSLTQGLGSGVDSLVPSGIKIANGTKTVSGGNGTPVNPINGLPLWDNSLLGQIQITTNDYGTFTNKCNVKDVSPCPADTPTDINNVEEFTPINELIGVQAFIGNIVYTETDPAKQDEVTVTPDFKISYTRKGNSNMNNIQSFTVYLVGGKTSAKSQIILN
ncbi:S-layer homology domain-containing protein [Paenibacillus chartarius]|uniref:S-layer homology domain-containing protein n=1 Tax=Paenibacillus chartarius TaxID=747481 RepID=A0ABV6DE07_9BACL